MLNVIISANTVCRFNPTKHFVSLHLALYFQFTIDSFSKAPLSAYANAILRGSLSFLKLASGS